MMCKCGYTMSDTIVPNNTNLRIYNTKESLKKSLLFKPSECMLAFHCECCHRIHVWGSQKFLVFGLPENNSIEHCRHFPKLNVFYIKMTMAKFTKEDTVQNAENCILTAMSKA